MRKRHSRPREGLVQTLRTAFAMPPELDMAQPLLHVNCRGRLEVENCSAILEYGPQSICLQLRGGRVRITGERLLITALDTHLMRITGRLYRLDLLEEQP